MNHRQGTEAVDECEHVGDVSSDFSPAFDLGRKDRLRQVVNWRRAQSLAGHPGSLFDFFVAFDVCTCNGWSRPMCERHRQWAEERKNSATHAS